MAPCFRVFCFASSVEMALFMLAGAGTAPLIFAILVEFCLVNDEKNMLFGGWCTWFQRGVRVGGVGGINDVRCGLQTKMMLFGGWWTKHVVRWMMHLVSKGGLGGLMTFVVDCKPRWCCLVDDEQNMLFGGWCVWFQRGGSGGGGGGG